MRMFKIVCSGCGRTLVEVVKGPLVVPVYSEAWVPPNQDDFTVEIAPCLCLPWEGVEDATELQARANAFKEEVLGKFDRTKDNFKRLLDHFGDFLTKSSGRYEDEESHTSIADFKKDLDQLVADFKEEVSGIDAKFIDD